jgi:hypothetical protein
MLIRKPTPKMLPLDEPVKHRDAHKRPLTRRDFISQGFLGGAATVIAPTIAGLFANPRQAAAALSSDLGPDLTRCGLGGLVGTKIPFICIDLAGGANMVGSNVLAGGPLGQLDFLSTQGYAKQGLPGDMVPSLINPATNLPFTNTQYGLAFHSDSAFVRGIMARAPLAGPNTNGAVIPARSENDTGNNPHNPMYGIYRAGAEGELVTLIGSQPSDSGGNSMAPAAMIDLSVRPTKVDSGADVRGFVDTGGLAGMLGPTDTVAVMEAIQRIGSQKMNVLTGYTPNVTRDEVVRELVKCGYLKSADVIDRFGNSPLDPDVDPEIVGPAGIFTQAEYNADREFRKTAAVMKMVISGYAGAGTITMGGYDYHGQGRATGEVRDFRAGQCMGACLEYARRKQTPLMLYVFSDGSLSASNQVDNTADGRGKFMWVSDNQQTAASFFLVYSPAGRPPLYTGASGPIERRQQLGYFRASGDVETASSPAANNVNLLVQTVVLNFMALHGEQGQFGSRFPGHGLGNIDQMIAFNPIPTT